jgi:predicted dehydrogenase/threonine dehydrogenase-like Zn-dependent dehydrogenase
MEESHMKQLLQSLDTGRTGIEEVPCPQVKPGHLLIRTTASLISAGTEKMLVEFGKANLLNKARQQPEKVRQVLDKVKTDGLIPTINAVRHKLDQPIPMGYCNVGVVLEVGPEVTGFSPGDRVVSNGNHAEVVCVPKNLCVKIPDTVSEESAAYAVIGAIGLQGIRLAQPTLGEAFVVTGMGLVGLVAAQLLRAHGCRVLGIDYDQRKLELARQFGCETVDLSAGQDPLVAAHAFSRGRGVDAVLITASTKSNEPVHQAALMSRKRGRIVLVGVAGLELNRNDFYQKELSLQVSCSYGPGRYDPIYEQKGQDYPVGFVRWTEQRNFEAVLDMLAEGRLDAAPLTTHRFPLGEASTAYETIRGGEYALGVILQYDSVATKPNSNLRRNTIGLTSVSVPSSASGVVGFIGAGKFASQVLMPAFSKAGAVMQAVASVGGVSSVHTGKKYGFVEATTDTERVLANSRIDSVVITTRHDTHARFACRALAADKHLYVEKPLATTKEQLKEVLQAYEDAVARTGTSPILMVGFNRRFAPHIVKMKVLLDGVGEPKTFIMTVNAGAIPVEHWTQDPVEGGGRILGEGCHFVDLLRHLVGAPIISYHAVAVGRVPGLLVRDDKVTITLTFADGSMGTIHYFANGHKSFPKERLEVFCAGRILQLDNFRILTGYGWPGFKRMKLWTQDKGHTTGVSAFIETVRNGKPSPIPLDQIAEVTRVSIELAEALQQQ